MYKHYSVLLSGCRDVESCPTALYAEAGGLAQMVERPLSMREVPGSIPGSSKLQYFILSNFLFWTRFWQYRVGGRIALT